MNKLLSAFTGIFAIILIAIFAMLSPGFEVLAQAVAAPVVAAAPTFLDGILNWITNNTVISASVVAVLEVILRIFPTSKAASLLVPIKYVVSGVGTILKWLGDSVLDPLIKAGNNSAT